MSGEIKIGSLFAGIGGIDLAFQNVGFKSEWAVEMDNDAALTYAYNFPDTYLIRADIREIEKTDISDVDIITAGFPCQPFSVCGKQRGFLDYRGNLFFEILRIADAKIPKIIFLENVANIVNHDAGRTFDIIKKELLKRKYYIKYLIADACNYGVPQHRTRIYIVAFKNLEVAQLFGFPKKKKLDKHIFDLIEKSKKAEDKFYIQPDSDEFKILKQYIKDPNQIYRFSDYGIQSGNDGISFTLKANMGTWKNRIPIIQDKFGIRVITPEECLALQGFPDSFKFPDIKLESKYKQCGNTVVVPLVTQIAESLYTCMANKG